MRQTVFVSSLTVILVLIASSNFVLADTYVNDPNNCPTTFQSQTCAVSGEVMCGFNNNILFCSDPSSLTAPTGNSTSTTNISSSFGGGYIFDCESYDGTAPFCDSGGSYECDRNETTHSTNNRVTICVGTSSTSITGGFGISTPGDCRSGFFACSGTDSITSASSLGTSGTCGFQEGSSCGSGTGVIDSTSSSQCLSSSTANCVSNNTLDCNNDDSDGNIQTCNGGTDGCEITEGGSCGSGTGTYATDTCQSNTGHCTSSTNLDCDNDDSDSTTSTCNGANGCEITPGGSCTTSSGLSGTYASTCSGGAGVCVPTASDFNTGTETGFSSDSDTPLLWGVQYGLGALINFTNSVTQNFFVVTNNGTVGIGMNNTSVPASMLHVNSSSANTRPIITVENQAGDFQMFRTDATPEGAITGSVGDIAVDSTNGMMYIKETGSSTNTGWSEIGGGSATSTSDDDGDTLIQVEESSDEDKIRFDTAGTERMIIDNIGRIGIGTTSPSESLTVADGDILQTPGNPVHVGSIVDSACDAAVGGEGCELDEAHGIFVQGNYAYVTAAATNEKGMQILDISDPTNPTHVGAIDDDATTKLSVAKGIHVSGNYAYVVSQGDESVEVLDISDPTAPTHAGTITDDSTTALNTPIAIFVQGNYAYVADAAGGVEILDVSDPTNPTHAGVINDDGTTKLVGANDIHVQGDYAYVASLDDESFQILNVTDPTAPTHAGVITDNSTMSLSEPRGVYVRGNHAYVASVEGVAIFDVSDPDSPVHLGSIADDGTTALSSAFDIFVQGNYAYVTSLGDDGIEVLDISNSTSPTHVGSIVDDGTTILNNPTRLFVQGNYIYVTSAAEDGVAVLQINGSTTLPAAEIGSLQTSSVHVDGAGQFGGDIMTSGSISAANALFSGKVAVTASSADSGLVVNQIGTGDSFRINDESGDTTPFVINGTGSVGIGTASPNARLHVGAGTATVGPFQMTSGTLLTTPVNGTLEYSSTTGGLYFTSGGYRDQLNKRISNATVTEAVGTWTARSAAEANEWNAITWSPKLGLFAAVSDTGTNRVMTSSDGINWTARSAAEANEWNDVAWSPELGLFAAVSDSGTNRVMTSTPPSSYSRVSELVAGTGLFSGFVNATSLEILQTGSSLAVNVTNTGTGDSFRVNDQSGDTTSFVIDDSGNVLVGGTSETLDNSGFSLGGDDVFVAGTAGIEGNIYTDGSFVSGASLTLSDSGITDSNGDLSFTSTTDGFSFVFTESGAGDDFIVDTNTLVVESDNNRVGIGTVTPNTDLQVIGNIAADSLTVNQIHAVSSFGLEFTDDSNNHGFFVRDGGNVGVGTNTPSEQLHVAGNGLFTGFLSSTSLGVGTTTPSHALHVVGSLNVTDAIVFPDNSTQNTSSHIFGNSWFVSTATFARSSIEVNDEDDSPTGIFFRPDGKKMYVMGNFDDEVHEFTLSSSWNVTSANFTQSSTVVKGIDTAAQDVFFRPDGTKMYVAGNAANQVHEFTLSSSWDVSTASFTRSSTVVGAQDDTPTGVFFRPDGTKMYVAGNFDDEVHEFTLSSPWDVSTATFVHSSTVVNSVDTGVHGIFFRPDGTKMYVMGSQNNEVHEFDLGLVVEGGKVGIGTSTPADVLEVRTGTTNNDMDVVFSETGTDQQKIIFEEAGLGYFAIYHDGEAANPSNLLTFQAADGNDGVLDVDVMTLAQDGDVGIGDNSPDNLLDLRDSGSHTYVNIDTDSNTAYDSGIRFQQNEADQWVIFSDHGTGALNFNEDTSNTRMVIDAGGNVGIGVSDPAAPLEIKTSDTATEARLLTLTSQSDRELNILQPDVANTNDAFTFATGNGYTFRVDAIDAFTVASTGRVGVGDTTPSSEFQVVGGICATDSASDTCPSTVDGDIRGEGTVSGGGVDLAERFVSMEDLEPGTVVSFSDVIVKKEILMEISDLTEDDLDVLQEMFDVENTEEFLKRVESGNITSDESGVKELIQAIKQGLEKKDEKGITGKEKVLATKSVAVRMSSTAYDDNLLGVVSTKPGLVLESGVDEISATELVALNGRVPVKVTLENGAIKVGDPITSSNKSGYAMKATESGKILGYALEEFNHNSDGDAILILINLEWYQVAGLTPLEISTLQELAKQNELYEQKFKTQQQQIESLKQLVCIDHPNSELCDDK